MGEEGWCFGAMDEGEGRRRGGEGGLGGSEGCSRMVLMVRVNTGWAKFMEWKYPVEIVVSSPAMFKGAGMVEAAATL